jgi:transcriptional regulator
LWGHVARSNAQWQAFERNPFVTVIYLSPLNHYISSSWYDHPNAPTWNYMSVQVYGKARILNPSDTWESVRRLMIRYEKASRKPLSLDTLPPDVQAQMNGLVAFEISITSIKAAFKLSQNRDDKNFLNIIRELNEKGDPIATKLAQVMQSHREKTNLKNNT